MKLLRIAALSAVLFVVMAAAQAPDSDARGGLDGVLISEFNPFSWEGVTLKNYGSGTADLKGYSLSDGEGSCVFTASLKLASGQSITVAKNEGGAPDAFADRSSVIFLGDSGTEVTGDYVFSNSGDQVYLRDPGGKLIDSLCYGNKTDPSWIGDSLVISGTGVYALRTGASDTDSSADWTVTKFGITSEGFDPNLSFSAEVTPFVFPESGGIPVFNAISSAQKTVLISIYQFTSANMYALLCDLEKKGVDVTLLIDAEPVNGDQSENAQKFKALVNAGGEVRLIGGNSGERYANLHAKYAVIDGKTTVVTTENWTTANLSGSYGSSDGNRGWGAVIESRDYAEYMTRIFMNDLSGSDVRDFSEMSYSGVSPASLTYRPVKSVSFSKYSAKVCPMLSPDNSYETEKYWIGKAGTRVYVQQQNIGNSYTDWTESTSPLYFLNSRAVSGVDVRLMISTGTSGTGDSMKNYISRMNSGSAIKAAGMEDPYLHNKGLVCDDAAIVSSVNWTSTSFGSNREAGAVILSKQVADYYAGFFEEDFRKNYDYSGLSVSVTSASKTLTEGQTARFSATVIPSGSYSYQWDFGDGRSRTTGVPYVDMVPVPGAHVMKVTVSDSSGRTASSSMDYVVIEKGGEEESGGGTSWLVYAAVIALIAIAGAAGLLRKK
ncbi:MAG: lamin tail domain-containing protein [Candidatus Methanomethylophilaceae archaeon]|nr:lamin tail domain-containing protein [Candidatus Methanomethylophilaceae archaeon]